MKFIEDDAAIHSEIAGAEVTFGLDERVLTWLRRQLRPGLRTLETGCGYSTTVFAAAATDHVCVTPFEAEPGKVTKWASQRGIQMDSVEFVTEFSEDVLPGMRRALDLVLIDGSHAFPQVFIDWF